MKDINIYPEFEELCPELDPDDMEALQTNLVRDGLLEPIRFIKSKNGKKYILDGHNRYKICSKHSIKMAFKEMKMPVGTTPQEWIIFNQLGRRNLDSWGKAKLADKLEAFYKKRAEKNLKTSTGGITPQPLSVRTKADQIIGGRPEDYSDLPIHGNIEPVHTRKETAKAVGISETTLHRAQTIKKLAPKEKIKQLDRGETTINAVYNEITQKPQKEKPKKLLNEIDWEHFYNTFLQWMWDLAVAPSKIEKEKNTTEEEEDLMRRVITYISDNLTAKRDAAKTWEKNMR